MEDPFPVLGLFVAEFYFCSPKSQDSTEFLYCPIVVKCSNHLIQQHGIELCCSSRHTGLLNVTGSFRDTQTRLYQQQEARSTLENLNCYQVPLCGELSQVPSSHVDTYLRTPMFRKVINWKLNLTFPLKCCSLLYNIFRRLHENRKKNL